MAGPKKLKTQIHPLSNAIGLSVFRLSIGPFVLCDFLYESLHHPIQSYLQLEALEAEPDKIQRKVTYRMYPKAAEVTAMNKTIVAHCKIYNTLLEISRLRYKAGLPAFDRASAYLAVKAIRNTHQWIENATTAQSVQATADRLIRAFDNFFRRVAKGETPGYPRFKSFRAYQGWGYKTYGDGWDLSEQKSKTNAVGNIKHGYGAVRLSGIGNISIHGAARFLGVPKTAEVFRKNEKWFLSVTFNVNQEAIERTSGSQSMAFDWGIKTLLTMVVGDSLTGKVEEIENPRWLKKQLEQISRTQQFIAKSETAAKKASGKQKNFPVSHQLRNAYARRRSIHRRIAAQRHDFYHQLTAALVKTYGLIITEELAVKNMTASPKPKADPDNPGQYLPNGASAKSGLNRSILDAAPVTLLALLDYKALEAGSKLQYIPTRVVKPTQRCHLCGLTTRLTLKDRTWQCSCGAQHDREVNAPRTMMRYAYEGAWWKENSRKVLGQELAGNHKVARNHFQA